jgi:AraC-like DNA-binding protein
VRAIVAQRAGSAALEVIALEVGYQDASFFSRLFRRKVGLTPARYRRRFGALSQRLRQASARRALT